MTQQKPRGAGRVLVTGAGGFIGRHLTADLLRRGRSVAALDLSLDKLKPLLSSGCLKLVEGDIAEPETQQRALEEVELVYHLAAAHLAVNSREDLFWRVNVNAIRSFTEACIDAGIHRFVHCSSVGVYGRIENPPANEESPCRPDIPYEITKLEGEKVLLKAFETREFPAVILRPVWVYGPGCPRTEKLFRSVSRGRFLMAGHRPAWRHCVYIRDMIEAFNLAAESPDVLGKTIIVGDKRAVTVTELVNEIVRLTGARQPKTVPLFVLSAAAFVAEKLFRFLDHDPPLSRRSLKFFTANTAFEIDRARQLLGFSPRYELSTGLRETFQILMSGEFWRVPLPEPPIATSS